MKHPSTRNHRKPKYFKPAHPGEKRLKVTPFTLVGRCLAPTLNSAQKSELADLLKSEALPFELLLATANQHRCTPLWYVRLREHGLLSTLPPDLRDYLAALHAANTERNLRTRAELVRIVGWFNQANIPVLLLKGAATFADDLYKDPGARLMQDLDLLVPEADVFKAKDLLKAQGYTEELPDRLEAANGRIVSRGHHLTPLGYPGSPVQIELHFRIMKGVAGQVLTAAHMWANALETSLDGARVLLPSLMERLLHTVIHATLTGKDFIRSHIRLTEIAEFATLLQHPGTRLDERRFWQCAGVRKVKTELVVFARIVQVVMHTKLNISSSIFTSLHLFRVINCSQSIKPAGNDGGRRISLMWHILRLAYYYWSMPKWAWRMITLTSENARRHGLPVFFAKRILDKDKWGMVTYDG